MTTLWVASEQVVYQGPELPYKNSTRPVTVGLHYAFYNQQTGEVWGRRISSDPQAIWHYMPGRAPDLRLPYEQEMDFMPATYMLYLIDYLLKPSI